MRPSFLKLLCNWATGASWTKCHAIQHKWCTSHSFYCVKMKRNEPNMVIIASASEKFGASCRCHGAKRSANCWWINWTCDFRFASSEGQPPPTQFNQFPPSLKDLCHLRLMTRLRKGQCTWAFLKIHLIWIYVASSWRATACTKCLYQHLLVNFFGEC